MALSAVQILGPREQAIPSTVSLQLRWYAAYTCANHEKRARDQMEQRSVESFLPVYQTVRRGKDRRMRLHMPPFPGSGFVGVAPFDIWRLLQVPRVVRLLAVNVQRSS